MEGVSYVTDSENNRLAIQFDLKKYRDLIEDILDSIEALEEDSDETITLEELKTELSNEGKL